MNLNKYNNINYLNNYLFCSLYLKYALINSSIYPSKTLSTLVISMPVLTSFTNLNLYDNFNYN